MCPFKKQLRQEFGSFQPFAVSTLTSLAELRRSCAKATDNSGASLRLKLAVQASTHAGRQRGANDHARTEARREEEYMAPKLGQQYDAEEQEFLEDNADLEDARPAPSIQNAAEARRKLEEYWAQKRLQDQLRSLDDWDED